MDLHAPVSTIMTTNLQTAHPKDPVAILDRIFREHRLHHVPVVEDGKVVGIISKSDFLYLLRGYTANEMDKYREQAMLRAFKVHEIMKAEVEVIRANESVKKAVALLAENRFRCLPVLNEQDELVGIVTTHDIIDMVNEME